MKYILSTLTIIFVLASCGQPGGEATIPETLEGKKKLLATKKSELKALESTVADLEAAIATQDTSTKEKSRTIVTAEKIVRKDFERFVEVQGIVATDDLVNVSSETGGRIVQLPVKEGQYVTKGQLIAKLDLEAINKQIAELETALSLAKDVYDRQKKLWDQQIGSEVQYLQAKNNKERLEKSMETARHQLTKANVYAPISGVLDMLIMKNGEVAAPGMPIGQILNSAKVKVVADVPEAYLTSVKRGQYVTVKFPVLGTEKKAKVSLVGSKIDASNRTFKMEIGMANTGGILKPNLLSLVLLRDFSAKNAVVVPVDLIQQEVGGKDFVYIVGQSEDGPIAKKAYVKTSESYNGEIIITEGLNGDEELIIQGARGLASNELIEVKE